MKFTDKQIIEGIKSSKETQDEIIQYLFLDPNLRKMAFSKINTIIDDSEEGENIFVDSLMALRKNILYNKFKGEASVNTYFVKICYNQSLNHLNKKKKTQEKNEAYVTNEKLDKSNFIDDKLQEFKVKKDDRYATFLKRRIYKQLSEKCRSSLRQKFWKNLKLKEIASLSQVNEQSIKNRLSNCKKKLRSLIEADTEIMELIKNNYGLL